MTGSDTRAGNVRRVMRGGLRVFLLGACLALLASASRAAFLDETLDRLPAAPGVSYGFAAADVTGDGAVDLFVAAGTASRLLINDGTGIFADESGTRLPVSAVNATDAVFVDVNGDGFTDLFVAGADGADALWLNNGSGVFLDTAAGALPADGGVSMAVVAVDVDGDGDPDLVIARHDGPDRVLINDGSGVFDDQTAARLPGQDGPSTAVVASDVNGDGDPDLLITGFHGPVLYLNNGIGEFAPAPLPAALPAATGAAMADVNGDGWPDLVLAAREATLLLLINDGAGGFTDQSAAALPALTGFAIKVIATDVTEDGAPDLVGAFADGLRVLVNDGGGVFADQTSVLVPPEPIAPRMFGAAAVDVDGDLDRDLLGAVAGGDSRLLVNDIADPRVRLDVRPAYIENGDTVFLDVDAFDEDGLATVVLEVIDPAAGVTGVPAPVLPGTATFVPSQAGEHEARLTVTDTLANVSTRSVFFDVVTPDVTPPVVTVQALPGSPFVGEPVAITVNATDDGIIVARSLLVDGVPVPVNNAGEAVFVPEFFAHANRTLDVDVAVTDAGGNTGIAATTITVQEDLTAPVVTLQITPASPVNLLDPVSIQVTATDAESPVVLPIQVLLTPPSGVAEALVLDPGGNTTYTPVEPGIHDVSAFVLNASNKAGLAAGTFEAVGTVDATPPQVTLTSDRESVALGGSFNVQVLATDDVSLASVELTANGGALALDVDGNSVFTPALAGDYTLIAVARDGFGNESAAQLVLRAVDPADDTDPPQVSITSPASDAEISGQVPILGSVADDTLASYTLDVAPLNSGSFTTFATGTLPVNGGELGVLDTATLDEGYYEVRLTGTDANGANASTSITVLFVDNVALGRFTLEYEDVRLAAFGLPLAVQRQYDSTSTQVGDFGVGWKMRLLDLEVRTDAAANVFITLPDGRRTAFALTPQGSPLFPIYATVYTPPAGIHDTLTAPGCESLVRSGGQWFCGLGGSFPPSIYELTEKNGTRYMIVDGSVTRVEDRNGNSLDLGAGGLIASSGRSVVFERDASNRITKAIDPNGGEFVYTYDGLGRLEQTEDPQGNAVRYTYDGNSNLIVEVETAESVAGLGMPGSCQAIRSEYHADGRVAARVDAVGNRTTYEYDDAARSETITDSAGNPTTYFYDERGNVLEVHDAVGTMTRYTYDDAGNQTSVTMPSGRVTTYTYDGNGNRLTETTTPEPGLMLTSTSAYNSLGQLVSFTSPAGDRVAYEYDANDNLVRRERYDTTGVFVEADVYTYDANGNRLTWTDPGGDTVTYTYSASGDLTSETDDAGVSMTYEYDANGNRTAFIDGEGNRAEFEFDGLNNPILMRQPGGVSGVVRWEATYDAVGNRRSITNANGDTTTYTYDCSGNLASVSGPEVVPGLPLETAAYEYDGATNITRVTDPRGKVTTYDYDAALRPTGRTGPDGETWGYGYDPDGVINQYESPEAAAIGAIEHIYDGLTRPVVRSEPERDITYVYDDNNRVISVTEDDGVSPVVTNLIYDDLGNLLAVNAPAGAVAYTYDAGGERASMTTPDGVVTTYTYDAGGRIETLTTTDGGASDSVTFTYDAAGRRTGIDYSNGASATYTYDGLGQITGVTIRDGTVANSVIASYDYTLDGNSQRTDVAVEDGTVDYEYDALYRLVEENINTTSAGILNRTWSYDAAGNRLDPSATYGDDNRLLTDASGAYSYDLNGNVTARGGETFAYDSNNRLVGYDNGIDDTTYVYDYLGRRVLRAVTTGGSTETTEYLYDIDNVVAELGNAGIISKRYTHGPNLDEVHMVRTGGQTYFYHRDALGSVVAITDAAGNEVKRYVYDAWGNTLVETGALPFENTLRFVAREFDAESGLYHMRARAYDPGIGRFIQKDPLQGNRRVPQTLNLYGYSLNNPVNFTDPTGRVVAIGYAALLTFPNGREAAAALAGFMHGFGTTNIVFIAEFLGVVSIGNNFDIGTAWDTALARTEVRMEEVKSALDWANSAAGQAGVAMIPNAFKSGAGFQVGFEINIGASAGPFSASASAGVSFEGSAGGFDNGVAQGLSYLSQLRPR